MGKTEPQVVKVAIDTQLFTLQQAATLDSKFAENLAQFLGSGGTNDGLYGKVLRATAKSIVQKAVKSTIISK